MQTYKLLVKNRSVKANSEDTTLVRTSIGVDQIHVMFDNAEWLSFPITATLAMEKKLVSTPITLRAISGSDEWVAESTFTIPWEVVQSVGALRVTFQGTDSSGNHIITAYGAPLRVEESGDVTMGDIPAQAPTVSQYEQAYAEMVLKLSELSAALDGLNGLVTRSDVATASTAGIVRPDGTTIVVDPDGTIRTYGEYELVAATYSSLGGVIPDGTSITVDADGTIHGADTVPIATTLTPGKVRPDGTSITVDPGGTIHAAEAVPIATVSTAGKVKPDGTSITVDADGTIHGADTVPIATVSTAGKVKPDGTTITVDQDGTIRGNGSADWEQANPSGAGYIRNRPFHDQVTEVLYQSSSPQTTFQSSSSYTYPYLLSNISFSEDLVVGDDYMLTVGGDVFTFTYANSGAGWDVEKGRIRRYSLYLSASSGAIRLNVQPGEAFTLPSMDVTIRHVTDEILQIPARYLPTPSGIDVGAVRPDGTTITMDSDGTIHSTAQSERPGPHWEVRTDSDGNSRLAIVIPEVADG